MANISSQENEKLLFNKIITSLLSYRVKLRSSLAVKYFIFIFSRIFNPSTYSFKFNNHYKKLKYFTYDKGSLVK